MSLHDEMEAALADLKEQQARIHQAGDRMKDVIGTASSPDRMITANVDVQGRLVDLKLNGTRYRGLAPAELASRIVQTVRAAQENAARAATSAFDGLLPAGLTKALDGGPDLDAMFDAALKAAAGTLFADEAQETEGKGKGDG